MNIKKVTVIGAGIMGSQIAMQAAIHGFSVVCYDIKKEMLQKAEEFADSWFEKRVRKQKMTEEAAKESRGNLRFTDDLKEAGTDTDLVIEAVSDLVAVKKAALSSIDAFTPEHTIYASNSSYIVSSRFADAVRDPSRVVNMHFFNPALVMIIVVVVKGPHVSEETFRTVYEFAQQIGKTPITVEKEISRWTVC